VLLPGSELSEATKASVKDMLSAIAEDGNDPALLVAPSSVQEMLSDVAAACGREVRAIQCVCGPLVTVQGAPIAKSCLWDAVLLQVLLCVCVCVSSTWAPCLLTLRHTGVGFSSD
jgi:hypothetical protein